MYRRPRLKDIAEEVGCSVAVVSHVVNQTAGNITCRAELRDRIIETAIALDYAPHYASRALKSQRSQTIGIYIPYNSRTSGFGETYEGAIIRGIDRLCRETGYDLLAISLGGDVKPEICAAKLNARRVDGLILIHLSENADWVNVLIEKGNNVAAINYYGDAPLDTINFNDHAAGEMAVKELYALGHRNIGYVGAFAEYPGKGAERRLAGFLDTCKKYGLSVSSERIFDTCFPSSSFSFSWEKGRKKAAVEIAKAICKLPPSRRPTALVGYCDLYLVLVMRELLHLGIRIPADISAIGIDDSDYALYSNPQLSSIRQPFERMGAKAAQHIIDKSKLKPIPEGRLGHELPVKRWLEYAAPAYVPRETTLRIKA